MLSIVAVGAHQDDVELTCGGTLLRYGAESRCAITIVCVSNGDKGGSSPEPPARAATAAKRDAEARAAARILNAEYECLGHEDGFVSKSKACTVALAEVLRRRRADIVFAPPPVDYHSDHTSASALAFDACLLATAPALPAAGEPLARAPALYYTDAIACLEFVPTHFVDIGSVFQSKQDLLRLHASQMAHMSRGGGWDLTAYSSVVSSFRGLQCGVSYAEAFRPALAWPRLRPSGLPGADCIELARETRRGGVPLGQPGESLTSQGAESGSLNEGIND